MSSNRNTVLVGLTAISTLVPNLAYAVEGAVSSVRIAESQGQKSVVVEGKRKFICVAAGNVD